MKNVTITGGAGFVGTNLTIALLSSGYNVKVIDDFSTGLSSNLDYLDCEVSKVSIVEANKLESALKGTEYIFHLAARGSVPRSIKNPQATFEVNSVGTFNVLEYARKNDCPIVFSSSSSVYGRNLELPKHEKSWVAPLTPYAASKLSGEALVQSYSSSFGFPATVFRFFNVFGPWQRPDHDYAAVVPKWLWKAMQNEVIEVYGDGGHSRDLTYIDSVTDVLKATLENEFSFSIPINLAFGNRITLNDLLGEIKNLYPDLRVEYLAEREGDVRDSQNNPTLLKDLFEKVTPVSFKDGLRRTNDWLLSHGKKVTGQSIELS